MPKEKFLIKKIADAEDAALKLRAQWGLGGDPIPNVTELLEGKGVKGDQVAPESSYRFNLLLKRAIAENLITPSQTMVFLKILPSRTGSVSAKELEKQALDAKDLYTDRELTIFTDTNVEDIYKYDD